ncbi:uncharacterized protein LOC142591665 [Dermacentor variabilis]|uniref:uncharacterized protein LOC142591665 n=1 Tax=Dermacentor variabilis TaxID=34621 RepID=UPI003F5BA843
MDIDISEGLSDVLAEGAVTSASPSTDSDIADEPSQVQHVPVAMHASSLFTCLHSKESFCHAEKELQEKPTWRLLFSALNKGPCKLSLKEHNPMVICQQTGCVKVPLESPINNTGAHHRTDRRSSARYHLGCPTINLNLPGTVPWPCPCCLSPSHASAPYASTSAACDERDRPYHQGAACVSNIRQIAYKSPTPSRANLWARWLCHDTVH